jgi:hypothetical protein
MDGFKAAKALAVFQVLKDQENPPVMVIADRGIRLSNKTTYLLNDLLSA